MAQLVAQPFALLVWGAALAAFGCSEPGVDTTHPRELEVDSGTRTGPSAAADGGATKPVPRDADSGRPDAGRATPASSGMLPTDAGKQDTCPKLSGTGAPSWMCTGARLGDLVNHYEGWATVERSSSEELVIYVSPERLVADAIDADAGLTYPEHAQSGGARCTLTLYARPLPTLPVGARVWLHENHDRDHTPPARLHWGAEITLRVRQRGLVLVAGVDRPAEPLLYQDSFRFETTSRVCSSSATCLTGETHRMQVAMQADRNVPANPGETVGIQLAGELYDLTLVEAQRTLGVYDTRCSTIDGVVNDDRLWITASLQPRDFGKLTTQLTIEPLP